MANKTTFLNLILPGNDEYTDQWDVPNNDNFSKIDEWAAEVQAEIEGSRGEFSTMGGFLGVDHNPDGTNKAAAEVIRARNSKVYGDETPADADCALTDHFEYIDFELMGARGLSTNLMEGLASRMNGFDAVNTVTSGAATGDGYPNYLTAASTDFQIAASVAVPVVMNINGHFMRIRKATTATASGASGTRYLVATKPTAPVVVLDRSTSANGALTTNINNDDKLQILQDSAVNFTLMNIQAGDILELLNSTSQGKYVISEVAPGGNVNQILVKGIFVGSGSGINYTISDPLQPTLAVETTYPTAATKCPMGQATWDGVALSAAIPYAYKGKYESVWTAVDTTSGGGYYNLTLNHNLGVIPRKITILASQANDDSGFVEQLSTAEVDNQLSVSISNNLTYNPPTATYVDVDATPDIFNFTPGSLTGSVTGSLSGSIRNSRSCRIKMSKTAILAKNPTGSLFYIDFDGNVRQAGFIKIICER